MKGLTLSKLPVTACRSCPPCGASGLVYGRCLKSGGSAGSPCMAMPCLRREPMRHRPKPACRGEGCESANRSHAPIVSRNQGHPSMAIWRWPAAPPWRSFPITAPECSGTARGRACRCPRRTVARSIERRPVGIEPLDGAQDRAAGSPGSACSPSRRSRRCRHSGSRCAQTMPASTALVTCSPVALWYGASLRASSIDSCEPYQ